MKVLNMDEVVDVFNKKIVEPRDFKVKGVDHIADNVIVYLNIKDCYDNSLSGDMVNFANDFLYSCNEWKSLINTMSKGYLIQSNFNSFVNNVNNSFYNYYVVSGEFKKVRADLSSQLNNVLEKLYEYSMYRINR